MKRSMVLVLTILCFAAAAQAQQEYWLKSISGTYYVSYEGYLVIGATMESWGTVVPGAISGIVSINSDGSVTGTSSVAIVTVDEYEVQGTATMTSDCTGVLSLKGRLKGTTQWTQQQENKFVFLRDEKEIRAMMVSVTGATPVVLSQWKRLSPVPGIVSW
jgi:hypothetical protein